MPNSTDRDDVLDALASGLTIPACARRFSLSEADVSDILKSETDRVADGAEMRAEWMLTARRLREVELKFHAKAVADLDCAAAVVSIKASERRATLTGANAPPAHLVHVMTSQVEDSSQTNTQKMLEAVRALKAGTAQPLPDQPSDC